MTDWTAYLDSVCDEYSRWWDEFTATDVLDLEVEAIEEMRSPLAREKKVERLGVLAGLRKYAKERVLLVGVPGSGKSTALRRLLLEVAQEVKEGGGDRIPVLVELRYATESIFQRIVKEIKKRDRRLRINERTLEEELLYEEKFLLLFDGLNELPSDAIKVQLQQLEADYPDIWMVFTTRNLGNAGIVNIEKQLTLQPLTEEQMKIFVRKQQQGEQILQQLGPRLRELGKTPMFLWMLCKTVRVAGDVPRNAGELLHRFVLYEYERGLKKEISAGDLRECWQDLLEELALAMMPSQERLDIRLVVSRKEAEEVLERFLAEKGESDRFSRVKQYLRGLLAHHLLQVGSEDELVFHHQLIQEYYAAMRLKGMISGLTDEELQRDYLNLFEWTEAIALMLGMLDDEEQAVRVVRSALAVDWQLGARLAGEVKREFQEKTVALLSELDVPLKVKIELWGMTRSDEIVSTLEVFLQEKDDEIKESVVQILGNIASEKALNLLIKVLHDGDKKSRKIAIDALKNSISKKTTNLLLLELENKYIELSERSDLLKYCFSEFSSDFSKKIIEKMLNESFQEKDDYERLVSFIYLNRFLQRDIKNSKQLISKILIDEDFNKRSRAVEILGIIRVQQTIELLIEALKDSHFTVRWKATEALGHIPCVKSVKLLTSALKNSDYQIRWRAAIALGKLAFETQELMDNQKIKEIEKLYPNVVNALIFTLEDEEFRVRKSAANALFKIANFSSQKTVVEPAIKPLINSLRDENSEVSETVAFALQVIASEQAVFPLLNALQDENVFVRRAAAYALGYEISETDFNIFINALQDSDSAVRCKIIEALGKYKSEKIVKYLIDSLTDKSPNVRKKALQILDNRDLSQNYKLISILPSLLQDPYYWVKDTAIYFSRKFIHQFNISENIINLIIKSLKDPMPDVRRKAIEVLKDANFNNKINILLEILKDSDPHVSKGAAVAIGKIDAPTLISQLLDILKNTQNLELLKTIAAIQARAKYYNHALTLPISTPDPQEQATLEDILLLLNQTLKTMSESPKYQVNTQNFQVVEKGHGGYHTHNYAQTQDLKEAAAEIQQLLQQLQEKNPNATEAEIVQEAIQSNPTLKIRFLNAIKQGGIETLNTFIPGFSIIRETILGFLQNDPDREVRQIAAEAIAQLQQQNPNNEE